MLNNINMKIIIIINCHLTVVSNTSIIFCTHCSWSTVVGGGGATAAAAAAAALQEKTAHFCRRPRARPSLSVGRGDVRATERLRSTVIYCWRWYTQRTANLPPRRPGSVSTGRGQPRRLGPVDHQRKRTAPRLRRPLPICSFLRPAAPSVVTLAAAAPLARVPVAAPCARPRCVPTRSRTPRRRQGLCDDRRRRDARTRERRPGRRKGGTIRGAHDDPVQCAPRV